MRKLATLLAASAAIATVSTTTAAHAQTPPPPAWTCSATVTGVQLRHQDLRPVANTLAVQEVTGVVVCEATGLLTHAPVNYLPLYQGGISLHVKSSTGANVRCDRKEVAGVPVDVPAIPSVGPTLVMADTAVCIWEATDDPVTYWPAIYWSTSDLDGVTNVTISGADGTFLN